MPLLPLVDPPLPVVSDGPVSILLHGMWHFAQMYSPVPRHDRSVVVVFSVRLFNMGKRRE